MCLCVCTCEGLRLTLAVFLESIEPSPHRLASPARQLALEITDARITGGPPHPPKSYAGAVGLSCDPYIYTANTFPAEPFRYLYCFLE